MSKVSVGVVFSHRSKGWRVTVTEVSGGWIYWMRTTPEGVKRVGRCQADKWDKHYV